MKSLALALAGLLALSTPIAAAAAPAPAAQRPASESAKLHALLEAEWNRTMAEWPTWASTLGDRRWNDRWPEMTEAAAARRAGHAEQVLTALQKLDRAKLSAADQLNWDLFATEQRNAVAEYRLGGHLLFQSHMGGVQTAHDIVDSLRFETVSDYEDWIKRLEALPAYLDQSVGLLRVGIKRGLVPPRAILERVPEQLKDQLPASPEESPFYKPFTKFPAAIPASEQARLRQQAQAAIRTRVVPAYERFERFFNGEYLPAGTATVGLSHLPGGPALYRQLVRATTTSELDPHRIHELGLAEVARIRREMEAIKAEVGFKGTLGEFFASLKADERFFGRDAKTLLTEYRALTRQVDPALVKVFKTLPRAPYAVEPIPAELAPNSSAAYYMQPAADGSRGGTFYVNLHQAEKRPTYEMIPLVLHETVPGHHLQIALAQEQGELPKFRRYGGYTAYIEGWGLYAESLGGALGLYDDPYVRFGRLNMEMRRALRLVCDTGMHHEGWDRARAIAFFKENAAKQELEVVNEIDRYLAWPSQALAYKVGELKIQELRAKAAKTLGARFDLRDFHEVVLAEGALPLTVLERRIEAWLATKRAAARL